MKSYSVLFFFIFCTITQLKAQEIDFGAKAGINLSTVTGNGDFRHTPRLAYHFGGFTTVSLGNKFSISPELLYLSIGTVTNITQDDFLGIDPITNISIKSVERANFLAVPVNLRYNFSEKLGLDFGPQVSFLLNSVTKGKGNNDIADLINTKVSGDFRPDYGANLGITFALTQKLLLQFRYYQGLKDLRSIVTTTSPRRLNIALQLSAGYVLF